MTLYIKGIAETFVVIAIAASVSNASILFETNFDNVSDWTVKQGVSTEACDALKSCVDYPANWDGWYQVKTALNNSLGPAGANTINIAYPPDGEDKSGNGKSFVLWDETQGGDDWTWRSDGQLTKLFPNYPVGHSEFFIRFWMRFQEGYVFRSDDHTSLHKIMHISHFEEGGDMFTYFTQGSHHPVIVVQLYPNVFQKNALTISVSNRTEVNYDVPEDTKGTLSAPYNEEGMPVDGKWHQYEFYFKRQSALGVADGVQKIWYDGKLLAEQYNVMLSEDNGAATPTKPRNLNCFQLGGNSYNPFTGKDGGDAEQWYAFDNVVLYTPLNSKDSLWESSPKDGRLPLTYSPLNIPIIPIDFN